MAATAAALHIPSGSPDEVTVGGFRRAPSRLVGAGLGVFTLFMRAAHVILMSFPGVFGSTKDDNNYCLKLDESRYVNVPDGGTHMAHYINGGVMPNIAFIWTPHGVMVVTLYALPVGTELYSYYYYDMMGK